MIYTITTGQFEKGTTAQQAPFIRLFGSENVQYRFDFYFHWYNIAHEYGHCLCNDHKSDIVGLKQELLVNRFAVHIWRYAGYEKELSLLRKMLDEILKKMKSPVPSDMTFLDYYEQIWETELIMEVPVYGYFQFKCVQEALKDRGNLTAVFQEMGIRKENGLLNNRGRFSNRVLHKKYSISSATAKEVLNDLRHLLPALGIQPPMAEIELTEDPSVHCLKPLPC